MRKSIIVLLLLLMVVVPASADEFYNFLKQGYGFIEGTETGDLAGGVGLLEPLQTQNPPFDFDYDNFEVTWVIEGMAVESYSEMGTFQSFSFAGGTIGIYEDADFDLDYGVDTATGIATGSDGVAALTGTISTGSIFYNTFTEVGTFLGICMFDGGSRLVELGDLANQEWEIFDGISGDASTNVPPGYHTRWSGRITTTETVATEGSSLSRIRALY
jgi:hypothetical protein